ncbi:MAG: hypothetical protein Q4A12_06075, partial [Eubacteriales bacterium]|nr:hypothetical protein [Eubacteriales bacterium]
MLLISGGDSSAQLLNILNLSIPSEHYKYVVENLSDMIYKKESSLLSVLVVPNNKSDLLDFSSYRTADKFSDFIKWAKDKYDYVIIDGSCVCDNSNTEYYAKISDFSLLVVKQNHSKITHINDT